MIETWRSKLKAGARSTLDVLVACICRRTSKEQLAAEVEMTPSGGIFQTYLGTVRRNGLMAVEDGKIKASDSLFIS
jgi:hypothetical protein